MTPSLGVLDFVAPVLVAVFYILACSGLKEPARRNFNAILLAGAGAAYLNGGLGLGEFGFTAAVTFVAFKGLHSYVWIGLGGLLHTGWDVLHHLRGNPIIPFVPNSSLGCAVCDPVLAIWCFTGGPSLLSLARSLGGLNSRPP